MRYTVSVRYPLGMGQKTSVYLTDEVAARVKASGLTPGELIRRGLDPAEHESLEAMLRRVVREEARQAVREELAAALSPACGTPGGSPDDA